MYTSVNQHPGGDNSRLQCEVLSIQIINIRSIRSNLELFITTLLKQKTDLIVLTETWSHSSEENLFGIPGYKGFHKANDNYRAGGVSVFVKEEIHTSDMATTSSTGGERQVLPE